MKKLVKTAKQQFEERLGHFNLMQDWNNQCSVGRIGKDLDGEGVVIFIHESEEDGFSEYHYPSFSELRDDSNFVQNCLKEFSCGADEFILSMVRWFTYDSTENPFDAVDIYFPADTFKLNSSVEFHDLYEEVPDVRVITAKEQWEEASADAKVLTLDEEHTLKVKITDKNVVFYRSDDMYARIEYPSLEQMRADTCFVCEVTDSMNEANMQDDIAKFLRWVRVGGDFPIPLSVIFHSDYQNYKFEGYEDKELHQEQSIEQMLELTQEQKDALKAFEEASDKLKRSGVMLVSYWDENEFYAINGGTQLKFDSIYDYKEGEYTDISNVLVKKHLCKFGWDLYWGVDCSFCAKKF